MAASMMQKMANSRPQKRVSPARNGERGIERPVEAPAWGRN